MKFIKLKIKCAGTCRVIVFRSYCKLLFFWRSRSSCVRSLFSNDDGNGRENIISVQYSSSLKMLNYVNFPRVEFLGTALIFKEEKNCRRRFTLPIKSRLRKFSGRTGTAKQMYKKSVLQVQNCFFAYLTIAFLTFSLPSPSSLLI